MIKTVISSARQNAIEPTKPQFRFWFTDEPQFAAPDLRGRFAHMLKCYRAQPRIYSVKKTGVHVYEIRIYGSAAVAMIAA
jgi:hypothetical protein